MLDIPLLMAQGFDGIEPRGFPRGVKPEDNTYTASHRDGDDDGRDRDFGGPMLDLADQNRCAAADEYAEYAASQT